MLARSTPIDRLKRARPRLAAKTFPALMDEAQQVAACRVVWIFSELSEINRADLPDAELADLAAEIHGRLIGAATARLSPSPVSTPQPLRREPALSPSSELADVRCKMLSAITSAEVMAVWCSVSPRLQTILIMALPPDSAVSWLAPSRAQILAAIEAAPATRPFRSRPRDPASEVAALLRYAFVTLAPGRNQLSKDAGGVYGEGVDFCRRIASGYDIRLSDKALQTTPSRYLRRLPV